MSRQKAFLIFSLLVLTLVIAAVLVFRVVNQEKELLLKVTFLDVGQGDSVFIESPAGTQILVDGGAGTEVLRRLSRTMGFFDRSIDLVVATHPDQDHIGGLVEVFRRYNVKSVLLTENESDTPVSDAFQRAIGAEGATLFYARSGQVYDLGVGPRGSTTLAVFFPDRDPRGLESNTSSIVAQLRYGEVEFMLTGDSPVAIEEYLITLYGDSLESEVLKAGHHGSRTSSSEEFVKAVSPTYAIISAGEDNRYGHPHKEVLEIFKRLGVTTKNTAGEGSIQCSSDGVSVGC